MILSLVAAFASYFLVWGSVSFTPLPLVPAAAFVFGFAKQRAAPFLLAAIARLAYAFWEFMLQYGGWCDEECNIRVDLILIVGPALAVASAIGLFSLWKEYQPRKRKGKEDADDSAT